MKKIQRKKCWVRLQEEVKGTVNFFYVGVATKWAEPRPFFVERLLAVEEEECPKKILDASF